MIIGGGVTGTGLARDLALRGVPCIVVERGDLNAGASGSNHGLLHSGARYASADPEAAMECRDESQVIKHIAASCVEDTGGLFVAVAGDDERYIADFPAHCQRAEIAVQSLDRREARELEPGLSEEIVAAYRVSDASVDPFKLSQANLEQAKALGARFLNRTEVVGMKRSAGRIDRVDLRGPTGQESVVHAEQIVTASGAWTQEVLALAGVRAPIVHSKGSIVITQRRVTRQVINRLRPPSDGDIIVPSGEVSLIGTTSVRLDWPGCLCATPGEVNFLLNQAAVMIPALARVQRVCAFAGVRSLNHLEGTTDRALSRSFTVLDHEPHGLSNVISVFGGKLTTFRLMAEKTADLVCRRLGVDAPCLTRTLPLPWVTARAWIDSRGTGQRFERHSGDAGEGGKWVEGE